MRVAVMGAGAVGSYFGAKLAANGADVVFIGRGDHLDRMRRNGLEVKSFEGDFHVFAVTARNPADVGVCDLILFTVKTYDSAPALASMEPMVGASTVILPLQNGVESEEALVERYGADKVVGGCCYVGAALERAGTVVHSAAGRIVAGELDGRMTIRLATIQNFFTEAGVGFEATAEISLEKWKKLAWNVSFNSISALTRATVGGILDTDTTRDLVRSVVAETVAVSRANGIMLSKELPTRMVEENRVYGSVRTSMLRDAERGSRLEYEALNGAVCRYGAKAGISTPANRFLYSLLKCVDSLAPA